MKTNKVLKKLVFLILFFSSFFCYGQEIDVEKKLKGQHWVWSVYNDVLNSQDRNTYYKYAPYYLDNPNVWNDSMDSYFKWYERDWWPQDIKISQNKKHTEYGKSINIAGFSFRIESIKNNTIVCYQDKSDLFFNKDAKKYTTLNYPLLEKKQKTTLILEFDGDYVDVYVNNKKTRFASFCKYDISTYNQLIDLVNTNECETWMIEYPKRADGSIDYIK